MTPQQIATQAAEAILRDYSVRALDAGRIGAPIAPKPFRDYDRFPEMPSERLAALILTAAAKMVRESGAVDALELSDIACGPLGTINESKRAKDAIAPALTALRAITDPKP